jgi:hypothetical protein
LPFFSGIGEFVLLWLAHLCVVVRTSACIQDDEVFGHQLSNGSRCLSTGRLAFSDGLSGGAKIRKLHFEVLAREQPPGAPARNADSTAFLTACGVLLL